MKKVWFLRLFIVFFYSTLALAGSHNNENTGGNAGGPEDECKIFGGQLKNGECYCGERRVSPSMYTFCKTDVVLPRELVSLISQKSANLIDTKTKNPFPGYIVKSSGDVYLASFSKAENGKSKQLCYSELSRERENDDRVLPGGAGPSGGRTTCPAINGKCPDALGCYVASEKLPEDVRLWEINGLLKDLGEFKGHDQLTQDQHRKTFGCWVQTDKEFIYREYTAPTQSEACLQNLFDIRDNLKKLRGAKFLGCDEPAAAKKDKASIRVCFL
jgi:hypothetical protein